MNKEQLLKEYREKFEGWQFSLDLEDFWLNKIDLIIDEMIGEEMEEPKIVPEDNPQPVRAHTYGYNQKRSELKKFKEDFNK